MVHSNNTLTRILTEETGILKLQLFPNILKDASNRCVGKQIRVKESADDRANVCGILIRVSHAGSSFYARGFGIEALWKVDERERRSVEPQRHLLLARDASCALRGNLLISHFTVLPSFRRCSASSLAAVNGLSGSIIRYASRGNAFNPRAEVAILTLARLISHIPRFRTRTALR